MIKYDDLDSDAKEQPIFFLERLKEDIVKEEHTARRALTISKKQHYMELNVAMFEAQELLRTGTNQRWSWQSELHKEIIWSYLCSQYHDFMNVSKSNRESGFPQIADRHYKSAEAMIAAALSLGFRTKEEKQKDLFLHGIATITAVWTKTEDKE